VIFCIYQLSVLREIDPHWATAQLIDETKASESRSELHGRSDEGETHPHMKPQASGLSGFSSARPFVNTGHNLLANRAKRRSPITWRPPYFLASTCVWIIPPAPTFPGAHLLSAKLCRTQLLAVSLQRFRIRYVAFWVKLEYSTYV
jgi:hypothetical protein